MKTLFSPPASGVHSWLFGRAVHLRRVGKSEPEALGDLANHVAGSTFRAGRTVTSREIADAIASAFRGALPQRPAGVSPVGDIQNNCSDFTATTGWPADMPLPRGEIDRTRLARVLADAGKFGLADLWDRSPVRPPDSPASRWILAQLFAESDLLCIGASSTDFAAKPLRDWTDADLLACQFIVPNPLRKLAGTTKGGTESAHSRDATGARRHIIVESDAGLSLDAQACVLEHLRVTSRADLAAAVLSGGKSLHGWFRVRAELPTAQLARWFNYAVTLGADPRLWLPEQFVRLPDGLRSNGTRQNLIYLAP